ncbi:MAG TPA: RNA pseudouridine synthase, partial [Flavobacterium sp.]|nr:RNA pseudouridine synthase [Flavobacterium sp.]
RAQLAAIGCPIKGDLKYGFDRSNPDGGICLHSKQLSLEQPVTKEKLTFKATPPHNPIWNDL